MSEIEDLKHENEMLLNELSRVKGLLESSEYWSNRDNIDEVTIRATKLGIKVKNKEKENEKLRDEIQKLKIENEELKKNKVVAGKSEAHNERGAGRKTKFTEYERETIKLYRIQGQTIKDIAEMYSCSIGLIHKIINE